MLQTKQLASCLCTRELGLEFFKVSFFFSCEVIEIEHRHIYCFEVFMISKLTNLCFYRHQVTDILGVRVISSLTVLWRGSPLFSWECSGCNGNPDWSWMRGVQHGWEETQAAAFSSRLRHRRGYTYSGSRSVPITLLKCN